MTGPLIDPLIDPEGRCERWGRLVPIECPEPDGLSCGTYVLQVTAEEGEDTGAMIVSLDESLRRSADLAAHAVTPEEARTESLAADLGLRHAVIIARKQVIDGCEHRGPALVVTAANAAPPPDLDVPPDEPPCPECRGTGMVDGSEAPNWSNPYGSPPEQCPRGCPVPDEPENLGLPGFPQGLLVDDYKPATWHTTTPEEMVQDALDFAQQHLSGAHSSVGPDGRITTVYPSGESYTDPTPRLARDPDGERRAALVAYGLTPEQVEAQMLDEQSIRDFIARGARGCEADDQGEEDPVF